MTIEVPTTRSGISTRTFAASVFVVLVALLATWAVATPRFAVPDEPAHLFKAYGTAHGEALGTTVEGFAPTIRLFDVPHSMGTPHLPVGQGLSCYFGYPEVPADCAVGSDGAAISTAAATPPFWYMVIGGGARLVGGATRIVAYRMMNAVVCGALFALAFAIGRNSRRRRLTPLLLVALTPITLFLAGGVQPSGFEIAAFAVFWSLSLHVDHPRAASATGGFAVGALFAAVLLSRFGAVLAVGTASAVVVILLGSAGVRHFLNRRFLGALLGTTAAAVIALAAWSRFAGASVNDSRTASNWTRWHVITYTVGALPEIARQIVGVLGWLDTSLPFGAYLLYGVFTLMLITGVGLSRNRRLIAAAIALIAALAVVPVVVNLISAPTAGLIWQGRYSVPLFLGLGVLGMMGWGRYVETSGDGRVSTMVRIAACVCFAGTEVLGFWQAMRRFTVGAHGKIWLTEPLPWQPSIAPMVLIAANIIFVLSLCAVVLLGTRHETSAGDEGGQAQRASDGIDVGWGSSLTNIA